MTAEEKLTAILSAALGVDATAVAEQINSDAEPQKIAETLFAPKLKAEFDRGNNAATSKTRRDVERAFRTAGVEDATYDNLSGAIDALQSKSTGSTDGKLTGEQALKHPDVVAKFNELKSTRQQEIDAAVAQTRQELTDRETELTNRQVRAHYEALVDQLNPNFSPERKAAQRERLIKELIQEGGHRMTADGKFELVDEHGELLTGKLGNPLTLEDRARERAEELYGLPAAQPRTSTGTKQSEVDGATAYDGPKTQAEYEAKLNETRAGSPERVKLIKDFKAFKESQTTA